jgi:hypothetical protein
VIGGDDTVIAVDLNRDSFHLAFPSELFLNKKCTSRKKSIQNISKIPTDPKGILPLIRCDKTPKAFLLDLLRPSMKDQRPCGARKTVPKSGDSDGQD